MTRVAENSDSETELVWVGQSGDAGPGNEVARRDLSAYGSVTVAVVEALEAAEATPPESNWVLDDVIDTDSLEQLFAPKRSGERRSGGMLAFDAWESTVIVTRDAVRVFADDGVVGRTEP
jgi:hypothetical protein